MLTKLFGWVGRLTSNKPINFDADANNDPDPGILTKFLPLQDRDNIMVKNIAGSAALVEGFAEMPTFENQKS